MTSGYRFEAKPPEPVAFDFGMYESMVAEYQRLDAIYGPRLTQVSMAARYVAWFLRQFQPPNPAAVPPPMMGVPVVVDDEVPYDTIRLAYADGSHRDVPVFGAGDG